MPDEIRNDIELAIAMGDADRLADLIEIRDAYGENDFDRNNTVEVQS